MGFRRIPKKSKGKGQRLSPNVKNLLEIMFHTGTINPNLKMNAEDIVDGQTWTASLTLPIGPNIL